MKLYLKDLILYKMFYIRAEGIVNVITCNRHDYVKK